MLQAGHVDMDGSLLVKINNCFVWRGIRHFICLWVSIQQFGKAVWSCHRVHRHMVGQAAILKNNITNVVLPLCHIPEPHPHVVLLLGSFW